VQRRSVMMRRVASMPFMLAWRFVPSPRIGDCSSARRTHSRPSAASGYTSIPLALEQSTQAVAHHGVIVSQQYTNDMMVAVGKIRQWQFGCNPRSAAGLGFETNAPP